MRSNSPLKITIGSSLAGCEKEFLKAYQSLKLAKMSEKELIVWRFDAHSFKRSLSIPDLAIHLEGSEFCVLLMSVIEFEP